MQVQYSAHKNITGSTWHIVNTPQHKRFCSRGSYALT